MRVMGSISTPRLFVDHEADQAWHSNGLIDLSPSAVRHAQVLRLQPGHGVTLFDGKGGQWAARIAEMGRQSVRAELLAHEPVERELGLAVTLAVCMPANDRMDDLVEKATELGGAAIVPLMSERSVLRLEGERSLKKQAHWQAVAVAACEQCGRNRVPRVEPVSRLAEFLRSPPTGAKWVLSLSPSARPLMAAAARFEVAAGAQLTVLSGPEGGLSEAELAVATQAGFEPVGLGPRVLRADTAPLAALAAVAAWAATTASAQ